MSPFSVPVIETDLLILGAGGAGLCAALHAADAGKKNKNLDRCEVGHWQGRVFANGSRGL